MILYHGSNMVFRTPLLAKCSPHKDFGQGFYLSDSFDVARRTARRAVRQRGGEPFVLVFEVDETKCGSYLSSDSANRVIALGRSSC